MTRYAVRHATVYEYGGDVAHSHHLLHLQPRDFAFQRCLKHAIALDPQPSSTVRMWMRSATRSRASNTTARTTACRLPRKCKSRYCPGPKALRTADPWEDVRARLSYHAAPWPAPISKPAASGCNRATCASSKHSSDYAKDCLPPRPRGREGAEALMRKIHREFKYVPGSTTNRTPIAEVLKTRRGVCQDFAHLMIGCLRSSGLAARYVSGYIRTARAGAASRRRRCLPRLGLGVLPAGRLGGFRSDQ